jgi:hypothetical protein
VTKRRRCLCAFFEKPWETGEEEFMYENNTEDDDALSYFISKSDYTDKEYCKWSIRFT